MCDSGIGIKKVQFYFLWDLFGGLDKCMSYIIQKYYNVDKIFGIRSFCIFFYL